MIIMPHFSCTKEPHILHFFNYDFYGETITYLRFRCKLPMHTEFFHKQSSMYVAAKTKTLDYWLGFRRMSTYTTDIHNYVEKA